MDKARTQQRESTCRPSLKKRLLSGETLEMMQPVRARLSEPWGRIGTSRGTTLVELLVALVMSLLILSASMQGLHVFQQKFIDQQNAMTQQQELRIGLQVLKEELRLTGEGPFNTGPWLMTAEQTEVSFWANLDGRSTTLRLPIQGTDLQLPVMSSRGWKKGRHLLVCHVTDCAKARLATNGVRNRLTIESALGRPFPLGSQIIELRFIRYYQGRDRQGRSSLMRQVGGGSHSLISPLSHFHLKYFTDEGLLTNNPGEVSRVMLDIAIGHQSRIIHTGVALRG